VNILTQTRALDLASDFPPISFAAAARAAS